MSKRLLRQFSVVPLLVLVGCSGNSEKLVNAKGVLKVDGKPLGGVRMAFEPADGSKSRGGMAITGEDGSFTAMHYDQNKPGLPAGEYLLTVSKYLKRDGSEVPKGVSPTSVGAVELFPSWWTRPGVGTTFNKISIPASGITDLEIAVDTKGDPNRRRIPSGRGAPHAANLPGQQPGT